MRVLKFGGTSVGSVDAIRSTCKIIGTYTSVEPLVVVCSAMSGITNLLTQMSSQASRGDQSYIAAYHSFRDKHTQVVKDLLGNPTELIQDLEDNHEVLRDLLRGIFLVREVSPRTLDYVLSFGERNSCYIISHVLRAQGYSTKYTDARDLVITDKTFNSAVVDKTITYERIRSFYKSDAASINIVTGFIASDIGGLTTTLGRGGSDYTASLFAAALSAERLDIFTDVDGVLTADPRKVDTAFTIPELSYGEAMEMSHFGAKVIYPPTISPALQADVPIYIRNTFNERFEGTYIGSNISHYSHGPIKGISALSDVAVITIQGSGLMGVPGISARLFSALSQDGINILLITQASSEYSITIAFDRSDLKAAISAIETTYAFEISNDRIRLIVPESPMSIVAVVGEQMKEVPGIAGRLFQSLGQNGINVVAIAQGSSELNISFLIEQVDETKALNLLHASFFDNVARRFHLYIAGVGLIGKELLAQIDQQRDSLIDGQGIDIKVVAVANSKRIYTNLDGVHSENYRSGLATSEIESSASKMIDLVASHNLPNSVFVDNTANAHLPEIYKSMLKHNVSVVTPNKVAASGSYASYIALVNEAKRRNIDYLYETNVGAGLPIISTIRDMVESGDQITSIEGVLSGSLSFIFNEFSTGMSFCDLVNKARELGYTEPDPRDDLSMSDVCRKIVILSRVAGIELDMPQVDVVPILPASVPSRGELDAFFSALEGEDGYFGKLLEDANVNNCRLRVIARTDSSGSSIALRAVSTDSPFFNLSGSDNMVVLSSTRYSQNPLVVKGPGAGAAVTAAGVFSDIISIAKRR